ncbi:protein translocase subunit SecD [Arenimonas fontis]|uniref:Protein translocase subunit SecD n=1 Tax=Arenimonas fontis TaxID=2608255 RepID=A0A5B2ZAK5_9GAMM|nr:protein translocase subunit SecD [Arenimonas fontis]KAA2284202.1 protein translocase subunit SecD [Arenimonas fontis]
MLQYSTWKYVLAAVIILLSVLYASPNLYPQDPAVQVVANRGGVVDDNLVLRVRTALDEAGLTPKSVAIEDGDLIVRATDVDQQTRVADLLRPELGSEYNVALNLASTVPEWLGWFGARQMAMGLDLRGGVQFLLEVDQQAAIDKRANAFADEITTVLREGGIPYTGVSRTAEGIQVLLKDAADMERFRTALAREAPELDLVPDEARPERLLARMSPTLIKQIMDQAIDQNRSTLDNRINSLGVGEQVIQRQGASRIVVQLPGVQDTAEARKMIGATATLEYRAVVGNESDWAEAARTGVVPPGARLYYMRPQVPGGPRQPILLSRRVIASGDQLVTAASQPDPQSGTPSVSIELNRAGGERMLAFTRENVGKRMGTVYIETIPEVRIVDGQEVRSSRVVEEVINAATIQGVFGRNFQTTGLDSMEEAATLARLLRAGSLAAPMVIIEERIIGPSLGAANIAAGTQAVFWSFMFVLAFFLVYYKTFGIVTNLALLLNLLMVVALMSVIGATLTLPGLAGIALTVGMSVDANVLINERIREELRNGNTPLASIANGYDKASGTITDANTTALLAGVAMAVFGSGPIRGFGITLILGIITSMYTAVSVSRGIATLIYGRRKKLAKVSI